MKLFLRAVILAGLSALAGCSQQKSSLGVDDDFFYHVD
jgi:hypothetical protein